jgi:hypothetical protein
VYFIPPITKTNLPREHGDLIEAAETKPNAADVNIKMEVEEPIAHQTSHHVMQAEVRFDTCRCVG